MSVRDTHSAVIVPVPAVESTVARHRRLFDASAPMGIPAHVTVLVPFAPPALLTTAVISQLRRAVQSVVAFDVEFAECRWFDRNVLWLSPDPADHLRRLASAVCDAFPEYQPYGGEFDEVIPHLTVADSRLANPVQMESVARDVTAALPIRARINSAVLMVGAKREMSWHTIASLPLGS